ncbi:MAG TPA: GGDEF domain-containing protein [Candidatus Limnocylindria bacterium]|nr:GGDEF domain-containing protein [Candidatus Limnocylindria bacterium]
MPDSHHSPLAPRLVAWSLAVAAGPLVVGLLRLLPPAPLTGVAWLPVAAYALLALAAATAVAVALAAAIRSGALSDGLGAVAPATLAAGAAAATLSATPPPGVAVAIGLLAAGVTWLVAAGVRAEVRGAPAVLSSIVVAGAVAVLATILFVGWPAPAATIIGLVAAVVLAGGTALALHAGHGGRLALLAGGAIAIATARPDTAESIVAIVPLVAACVLLAVGGRDRADRSAAALIDGPSIPALPPLAHDLAEGVLLLDRDGRLADWNVAAASLLELGTHPRGQDAAEIIAPLVGEAGWAALVRGAHEAGRRIATERGRPLELTVAAGGPDAMIIVVRDQALERNETTEAARLARELRGTIEELLDARRTVDLQRGELERASQVDTLTGVASRRSFLDRLRTEASQARRYSHPVAVVMIDIDDFASLNREHGLAIGDAVLRELALRLRLRMREADALGRLGGDCFAVILPHTDERGAAVFADAVLRRMVTRPVDTAAGSLTVMVSLGVALMRPGMDVDDEGLLAAADEALASARRGGGNRIAFDRQHGLVRLDETRRPAPAADAPVDEGDARRRGG